MTTVLLRDKDWETVDGHLCKVSSFSPWASVVDGKVTSPGKTLPYAVIEIDEINSQKLPEPVTGYVTHSMDFAHLWNVFEVRGVQDDEVVAIFWTKQNYRSKIHKLFSAGMPKLIVWVLTEESYRLWDNAYKPDYPARERFRDASPILELKPPVMN